MSSHLYRLLIGSIFLWSCQSGNSDFVELDLAPYGIPAIIEAPDSAEVVVKDYKFMRDIVIRAGNQYVVQVFEIAGASPDAAGEKLRQLESVRQDPFFKQILEEDTHGFIYSRWVDTLHQNICHDFRYVCLLDNKEYIFQTGLTDTFSLEAVHEMYKAVKQ